MVIKINQKNSNGKLMLFNRQSIHAWVENGGKNFIVKEKKNKLV